MSKALLGRGGGRLWDISKLNEEWLNPEALLGRWAEAAGGAGHGAAFDVNSTVPSALYLQGQVYQRLPPVWPFVVESSVTYVDWDTGPGVGGVWIVLARPSPGPYTGFGPDVGIPGRMWLSGSVFDSSGNFVSNVNPTGTVFSYAYAVPHHTRLTVHSPSNVDAEVSLDGGGSWTTIITGYDLGFTPTHIGLESGGARSGFDWLRFTAL